MRITKSIYLAARYSRHEEMGGVRDVLVALGYRVTSRWIDCHPDIVGEPQLQSSFSPQALNEDPTGCARLGQHDLDDLAGADTVISFTSPGGGGKGGRHIEFGVALASGKRMILCGPRENIFHTLPQVEHFATWFALCTALSGARLSERENTHEEEEQHHGYWN